MILDAHNFTSACNLACECVDVQFTPICGADGIQYYSPCHAGCLDSLNNVGDDVKVNNILLYSFC